MAMQLLSANPGAFFAMTGSLGQIADDYWARQRKIAAAQNSVGAFDQWAAGQSAPPSGGVRLGQLAADPMATGSTTPAAASADGEDDGEASVPLPPRRPVAFGGKPDPAQVGVSRVGSDGVLYDATGASMGKPLPRVASPASLYGALRPLAPTGGPSPAASGATFPMSVGQTAFSSPQGYLSRLAQIESSGDPNAQARGSSAKGLYQFTDGSWARYGGGGNPFNPQDATAAAVRLTQDNRQGLMRALGREPSPGELYLAHQQGLGGAIKLLSNPNAPAGAVVGAQAVVNNGGDPNMTAGQFANKWISKFEGGKGDITGAIGKASDDGDSAPTGFVVGPMAQRGVVSVPGVRDQMDPRAQMAAVRQLIGNPETNAVGMQLWQSMLAPKSSPFSFQQNGDSLIRVNNQTGGYDLIPMPTKPNYQTIGNTVVDLNNRQVIYRGEKDDGTDPQSVLEWKAAQGAGYKGDFMTFLRDKGAAQAGPKIVGVGGMVVNPDGSSVKNEGGAGSMDDETANFLAERVLAGDKAALVGLGRGAQGAENLQKIQGRVAQLARERGLNPQDILQRNADIFGMNAQARTFGNQTARMATASTEAQGAIQLGYQVSAVVPRTQWLMLNRAMQAGQTQFSDPKLAQFVAATNTIVNTYARAINLNGVPTQSDKEHAREMLSTAQSPEAYNAVLDQLQKEIELAHQAPATAQKMMKSINRGDAPASPPSSAGAPPMHGARRAPDGNWYVPDPSRPGKYLMVR